MAETAPIFVQVLDALLKLGFNFVFPKIPSTQLKAALQIKKIDNTAGYLWVPHYWAIYVHNGRGDAGPVSSTYLVWFRNPQDDPRYPGGKYPVKRSDIKRLTKEQFQEWASRNREIIRDYKKRTGKTRLDSSDYESMRLPMIVAKRSPRTLGGHMAGRRFDYDKGVPFFDNNDVRGMAGFRELANAKGAAMINKYITDRFERAGILNKKITATLQI